MYLIYLFGSSNHLPLLVLAGVNRKQVLKALKAKTGVSLFKMIDMENMRVTLSDINELDPKCAEVDNLIKIGDLPGPGKDASSEVRRAGDWYIKPEYFKKLYHSRDRMEIQSKGLYYLSMFYFEDGQIIDFEKIDKAIAEFTH